jgi:RNA polymerase sigma-70 factor (ECF subfamily)
MWVEVTTMSRINAEKLSTAALVELVRGGDPKAFELLWKRSESRVHSVVRAYVGNREDREDLVREVLLRAFKALDSLRDARQFHPWLDSSARRRCVDFLRRKGRLTFYSLDEPLDPESDEGQREMPSRDPDVEDQVVTRSMRRKAAKTLAGMSPRARACYELRTSSGASVKEIADMFDTTEGAVKSMVYRTRRTLEDELEPFRAA